VGSLQHRGTGRAEPARQCCGQALMALLGSGHVRGALMQAGLGRQEEIVGYKILQGCSLLGMIAEGAE